MAAEEKSSIVKIPMIYLGTERKRSEKSGNDYFLARFQKLEKPVVIAFYVPHKAQDVQNELSGLRQFQAYEIILTLSPYNEKPQVDLVGIAGEVNG